MIEVEINLLDLPVFPIQEIVDRETVRLIHVLSSLNRLKHWSNDDIGINNRKIKGRLLGCVVSQDSAFELDR